MSAIAGVIGKGLPYLVGADLRPVWETRGAPPVRTLLDFKLKDQTGRTVTREDLAGKIAIVSFFYSQCPGICPMTTKNLRSVQEKFKDDDRVIMLSLSITPEHDSPKVLKAYGRANRIDAKRWRLLTGERARIYGLARESFSADTFSARENSKAPLKETDFLHSENVYLLDGEQKLRGIYAGIRVDSVDDLARDAEALLQ